MAITWSNTNDFVIDVLKGEDTILSLTATVGALTVVGYSVIDIEPTLPASIVISANGSGVHVTGDSSLSFAFNVLKQYTFPDGTTGSALLTTDIPKIADLYLYPVDPNQIEEYDFTGRAHTTDPENLPGETIYTRIFTIKVRNSWDAGKIEILNIIAKNY